MNESVQERLKVPMSKIVDFCRRWRVKELSLFGSILQDDFRSDSDFDVLVTFNPGADWSLLDHLRMEQELQDLTGRDVDLVSRSAIEKSENWIRRKEILTTAQSIYVAR